MKRDIAKLLVVALILGFAITARFTVGAFSERERRGRVSRPGLSDLKIRPRIDPEAVGEFARFGRGKGDKDRNVRALEAKYFNRLSIGGKRIVLFRNGLLKSHSPSPGELQPEGRQDNEVSPLINPGDNIRVNNPNIDDPNSHRQSESCAAANGPNVIVGFNDDTSDNFDGYGISTDGGNTFTHKRIPVLSGGFNGGDPVVAFGTNPGEIYYASLALTESNKNIVGIAKSVDNGATFTTPVDASTSLGNDTDLQDKEWIAVDTNPNSPFKGNVYVSWTDFGFSELLNSRFIAFSRSTNGGTTFEPPLALTQKIKGQFPVQGSMPAVASDGTLYIVFQNSLLNPDGISIVKSTDGGKTFSQPKQVATFVSLDLVGGFVTGGNSVRTNSFPSIAVDQKGAIHVVYDAVPTSSPMDRSDVFYVRSTDGGNSFSAPRRLNDDSTTTTQLFPSIAVAADGRLGVRWWDRRNDPINDSLTDVYMTTSTDGGTTFSKNFRITDTNWVFGPEELGLNTGYHGDYDQMAAGGNNFYIPWSDERNSDPDVYFTFIPSNHNPNAPDFNISAMKVFDNIIAGSSVDFNFSTSGTNGFSGTLSLSASPAISGLTYSFASPTVTVGQSGKLTISTTTGVQPGTYLITVAAVGPSFTRKTSFRLTVYDPARFADLPINATRTPGFSGANSDMQIGPNGTLHLAFEDDTANISGNDVFYTQSVDGGKTYSTPIRVSTNSTNSSGSALTLDSAGNIYIVWASLNANQTTQTLFMSRSVDGGKSFSSPVALTPTSQVADLPGIAVDKSGNILVAYSDFANADQGVPVFVVRSTDGGTSFSTPVMVSNSKENAIDSANYVTFDSKGAAYLVYENLLDLQNGNSAVVNLAVAADGQRFAAPKAVSDNQGFFPHLALDKNDSIYVAFSELLGDEQQGFNFEVMFIKSTDKGNSFSPQINLSKNPTGSLFPYVILDNRGNVNVAWTDRPNSFSQRDIFLARSTDGGLTFGQPTNLSANSGVSEGAFGAADSNGNLFVAWTDDSSANTEVFVTPVIFFKPQPPSISGFNPTSGAVGSDVTILGSNFQGASVVVFSGNASVPSSGFTVSADGTQISTKVPQGAQTGPVAVTTALGTAVSSAVFTVTAGDFALSISPASQTVTPGMSISFTVNVQAIGSFSQPVSLSAAVVPPDSSVTTNFSSSSVNPGSSATLTVATTASTLANTFTITVTGTGGQIARTKTVTVNVISPDFSLTFSPAQMTVSRGQKGQITVAINRTGGFAGNVTVTAPDTKAIKVKLTPPSQSTTGASVSFSFKIKKSAPTGMQQLVFTGRDDSGRVRTGTFTLAVQ